jgi:hypothetical protein
MRIRSLSAIAALALTITVAGSDLASAQAPHRRIPGYQDADTGIFHPQMRGAAPDATVTPASGTFEVSFSITLKSPVPKGASVYCSTAYEIDSNDTITGTTTTWTVNNYSLATVSAGKATCTVTSYYSWPIPMGSTYQNQVTGAYGVAIVPETQVSIGLLGTNQPNTNGPLQQLDKLPATGSITKDTVDLIL